MFSAIQDASFIILKSIFEKLLFLGSYKGSGKKTKSTACWFYKKKIIRLNGMGKKRAPKKVGEKKTP